MIEEGAWADVLLVRGIPLDNLSLLQNFERNLFVTAKDGVVHKHGMSA